MHLMIQIKQLIKKRIFQQMKLARIKFKIKMIILILMKKKNNLKVNKVQHNKSTIIEKNKLIMMTFRIPNHVYLNLGLKE